MIEQLNYIQVQKQILTMIADNWELIVERGKYVYIAKCTDSTMLLCGGKTAVLGEEIDHIAEYYSQETLAYKLAVAKQYFKDLKGENHE